MAFTIKRHDLRPYLPVRFFQPDGVTPLDLSAATSVQIVVSPKNALPEDAPKFKKPLTPISAAAGQYEYRWSGNDTDVAGEFNYEFEIQWPGAEPQTIPAASYLVLIVVDDLG